VHPRIGKVIAAQVQDRRGHPTLQEGKHGDIGGHGQGCSEQAAEICHQPLRGRQPHMGLNDGAHTGHLVTMMGIVGLGRHLRGAREGTDPGDRSIKAHDALQSR
jgi:hypothetical protein